MRNGNLVGANSFEDVFDDEFNVVTQDRSEGLVGPVDAVGFAFFGRHVAPRDVGVTAACTWLCDEFSTEENRLSGRLVVLNNWIREGVLAEESNVFVILSCLCVIWQKIGDGVVTFSLRIRWKLHHIFCFRSVEFSQRRLGSEKCWT